MTAGLLLVAGAAIVAAQEPAAPTEPEVIHLEPSVTAPRASTPPGSPSGTETASLAAPGANVREVLTGLWFNYQALQQRGAKQDAASLIGSAIGFMHREGVRAAPEIAAAFLFDGRRALNNGDDDRAITAFRLAARLDPALSAAHFALSSTLLLREQDLLGGLRAWWDGVRALFRDPEALFYLAGSVLLVFYLGACWGTAVALGLIGWQAVPALVHDLKELLGGGASVVAAPLLAGAILLAPWFLPVPLPWLLAYWAAIFCAYARGAAKWVVLTTLGVWLLAGPFGATLAWHFQTATNPVARVLLQSASVGADLRHEPVLRQAASQRQDDPLYLFLLASAHRVGGRLDEAMSLYRQVLEIDPANARAIINLGNLHALRQEFGQAQTLYQKASLVDPSNALAYYNSHLAHLEAFNLEAADAALKRAQQVDEALVTAIMTRSETGLQKRSPQDSMYPGHEMWARALRPGHRQGTKVARSLMHPTTLAAGLGLLASLLLPGLAITRRSGGAQICERCGRPFCRRCQVITRFPDICSPCVHLFVLKDGLAPAGRDRKKDEVARHRRRQFVLIRAASLVLPGSGHVLSGRPVFGTLLLCAWMSSGIGIILKPRLPIPPDDLHSAALLGGLAPLLGLALLTWLAANLSQQERRAE